MPSDVRAREQGSLTRVPAHPGNGEIVRTSVQFHCPRDEFVVLLTGAVEGLDVEVTVEDLSAAGDATKVGIGDLARVLRERPQVRRFAVSAGGRELLFEGVSGFLALNRGSLVVDLGDEDGESLRQSFVTVDASDPENVRVWRRVLRRLKAGMTAGATVTNSSTGASGWSRADWYSPGAKRLQEEGIRILAVAGWNEYHFGAVGPAAPPDDVSAPRGPQ